MTSVIIEDELTLKRLQNSVIIFKKVGEDMYEYIKTVDALENYIDRILSSPILGIDTETTGLNPHSDKLRLIQIASEDMPTLVIDCFYVLPDGKQLIQKIMSSDAVKVFQNAKFDIKFLMSEGIQVSGKLFDTMLAGQLLRSSGGSSRVGLAHLVLHYLDETLSKEEQVSDFSGVLRDEQIEYAAKDAEILLRLRVKMVEALIANKLVEVARLEFACVYAIADIEYAGIYLDLDKWTKLTKDVEEEKKTALEGLYPYIGYPTVQLGFFESVERNSMNLNSNQQVLKLLREHGLELENSSKHALAQYPDHPIVKLILDYRHATKALSSFLHGFPNQVHPKTGRLHPMYGQNGAYSGRMSCGNPNIQQIPREDRFRECFTAPKGRKLVIADYSQIELRVIAQFSQDKRMLDAYRTGQDLHKLTASLMLQKPIEQVKKSERQAAKAVNFGLVFGMGAAGLKAYAAETYKSAMSLEEAELFKKRFFQGYRGVDRWQRHLRKTLPEEERTLSGRKFIFRQDSGLSGRYNTPIQGTAADILKNALGMLHLILKDKNVIIVAVVHDEIVLECDEDDAEEVKNLLAETMARAGQRYLKDVPVIAEAVIADSWAGK